tara:strand:- start:278 stop:577 length:300 start_codon:yes stop_codon:yes gene_type:complete
MIDYFDIIGYLGGFFATVRYIPQIIKVIKTGSSTDLSWGLLLMSLMAQVLTLIYTINKILLPIIIPLIVSLVLTIILSFLKVYYDNLKNKEIYENLINK